MMFDKPYGALPAPGRVRTEHHPMMTEETAKALTGAIEDLTMHIAWVCDYLLDYDDEDAIEPEDAFPDYPEPAGC